MTTFCWRSLLSVLALRLLLPSQVVAEPAAAAEKPVEFQVAEVVDVAPVWAAHPVGFALLTTGDRQYVAYYDRDRNMTVAQRRVGDKQFQIHRLTNTPQPRDPANWDPTKLGWDSHNSVTLDRDSAGYLHLSGNMHNHHLVYFKSAKADDAGTFQRQPGMVGDREDHCTYPRFLRGPQAELLFAYRDGRSGNGADIYNTYDVQAGRWSHLLDQPLLDGQGTCNAYSIGPIRHGDFFHLVWVWRKTPDCSTCTDVCYARSRDLVHWETSGGKALAIPITPGTAEVVDPVPVKGGIINGNTLLGFDHAGRAVITYHKYDANGKLQAYNARRETDGWKITQTSDWNHRWEFSGGGSINFEVRIQAVRLLPNGELAQDYHHPDGSGTWRLDEKTLKVIGRGAPAERMPAELHKVESTFPGMKAHTAGDLNSAGTGGVKYILKWETLDANRDRPRDPPWPDPSMLRVYKLERK